MNNLTQRDIAHIARYMSGANLARFAATSRASRNLTRTSPYRQRINASRNRVTRERRLTRAKQLFRQVYNNELKGTFFNLSNAQQQRFINHLNTLPINRIPTNLPTTRQELVFVFH